MTSFPLPFARVLGIQRIVCSLYGVSHGDMLGPDRHRAIARPRQIAMYLSRHHTRRSMPEIGRSFGGRDHTTVLHAIRLIGHLRSRDGDLDAEIRILETMIPPDPTASPIQDEAPSAEIAA